MRRVALLTSLIALLCSTYYAVGQSPDEEHRITLYPGWSAVGWLGKPASIGDLFQQLPQDVSWVYHWNANEQTWRSHSRNSDANATAILSTGQAIYILVHEHEAVEWQQQPAPLVKSIVLEVGYNLVAWAGADDTPFEQVVESFGDALSGAWHWSHSQQTWEWLNASEPHRESDRINRGDPLWIVVDQEAEFRPAAGVYPRVTLWGESHATQTVLMQVDNAVRKTVDFITEQYQLYAFSESDWSITFLVEDWLGGWQGQEFADTETEKTVRQLDDLHKRRKLEESVDGCFGLVNGEGLLLAFFPNSESTRASCLDDKGSGLLVHEYIHVVQHAFNYRDTPLWLVEGHARWVE